MAGIVVVGRTRAPLVEKIASRLSAPVIGYHLDWFADTEASVNIESHESLVDKTAVVVFQCDLVFDKDSVRHTINDYAAGFLHLVSALKIGGSRRVVVVLPYLPYARQERSKEGNLPGPLSMWAAVFRTAGVDHTITCDIHSQASIQCFGDELTSIPITTFWANHIKNILPLENLCIVSPDLGGLDRATLIAKRLECEYTFIDKVRIAKDAPVALNLHDGVGGKVAVIVDDIISTGKTAANAAQILRAHGAKTIVGCFTHAIFAPEANQRLAQSHFEKILITDTLTSAIKQEGLHLQVCSIADYIAEGVCGIIEKTSKMDPKSNPA